MRPEDSPLPADNDLPNSLPRPPDELKRLQRVWKVPEGWGVLTAVNNTYIGLFYIGTAILFLVLGGIVALLMRTQLALPGNDIVSESSYAQLFTMHGTVMMFLFAVPAVEAMAVYLLPGMLAARDLPFPRLSAYAFWAYAVGGIVFFCSIFFGFAPNGGWFMYPPLTSEEYSPSINADFWLLGIGFIEISAIAGAIELVVGILRTRAPGMSLDKMPVFAWAMLVVAGMIIFGFPPIILGTALLELERAFGWPFFIARQGGDPLLWQHLFWLFGHPEVYIIFLPAAGMVSMIVPTVAQRPLFGYRLVVLSLLATGFLSFGLWVHHMFATGLPQVSMSFFTAASMAIAIPSGIQVFCWIATLISGRFKPTVPALFILGFLVIFTLGGMTGVMLASVPLDWQVHDSYFVVAHFHYVLIGGMVFPLFAGFYYWAPTVSGKKLSERLGRWVFGLMFVGFNLAFFPMHITGLAGMPRRVATYESGIGWDGLNLLSTLGAYTIAAGIALFLIDIVRRLRIAGEVDTNPWNAGTLEWLPLDDYASRSIPEVTSHNPLWTRPSLREEVKSGQHYLPRTATGRRETIVTSPLTAAPQYVCLLPGPGWAPILAGLATAICFFMLTLKLVTLAAIAGVTSIALILWWLWGSDPGPSHPPVDIGAGLRLPVYVSGPTAHSWWATMVLILVDGTIYACLLFSYFFLWTVNPPGSFPSAEEAPPALRWAMAAGGALLAGGIAMELARHSLNRFESIGAWPMRLALFAALLLLALGSAVDIIAHWRDGLRPHESGYGAVVATALAYQALHVVILAVMIGYTIARSIAGRLNAVRRVTFDNTRLLYRYAVVQGLVGLAVIYLFPQLTR